MQTMKGSTTRTLLVGSGLVVCCLVGLPNLYDKFMIARFIAAAIGLAIVFLFALFRKRYWRVSHTPVFLLYLLFVAVCGCSVFWATNTSEAVFAFSLQLLSLLVIILFYNLLSTNRHPAQKMLWTSAAIVLAICLLFAVVQLFHVESRSFEQLYRVIGINGHKNLLACILFVLSAFLLTAFSIFRSKFPQWTAVVLFVVSLTVILLLKSRAVLLSLIMAGGFFWLMVILRVLQGGNRSATVGRRMERGHQAILGISIVCVFVFLTIGLRWFAVRSVPHSTAKSEIETKMMSTSSLVERCLIWEKTYCIVDKHPFAGCGIGNWQIQFPDAGLKGLYRADVWNVNFTKPHNEYLGVLSETGYVGLLLYVAFLTSLIVLAFSALRKTRSRNDFLFGAIVLSVFVGYCVNALFDFPTSRIEHTIWSGILMAILLQTIEADDSAVAKGKPKALRPGWNAAFLLVSLMLVALSGFRLKGERNTFKMQQAIQANDWKTVKHSCQQAVSVFYTIDPVGLPLHWYQGKAEKKLGNAQAVNSFRKAHHYAPYCKENLNDLGLAEYYSAHDLSKAEHCLKEAIRISPNYIYPHLNLAYIYLSENEPQKAKEIAESIYFDEYKREVMKADAVFFEPVNTEDFHQKIDADYEAVMLLQKMIEEKIRERKQTISR